MSDEGPKQESGPEVGSLGEEAAKLFAAVSEWARDEHGDPVGMLHEVNRHVATGAAECRYCPVCQLIAGVRGVVGGIDPEVRDQLASAASNLVQAAAGLLASVQTPPTSGPSQRSPE